MQRADRPVFVLMTEGEASAYCGSMTEAQCRDKRLSSWHGFLDEAGVPLEDRVTFDAGDGHTTTAEVQAAISQVTATHGPISAVVAAGFHDTQEYDHPDHRHVHQAIALDPRPGYRSVNEANADLGLTVRNFDSLMGCPNGSVNRWYGWLRPPCWPIGTRAWNEIQWFHVD